MERCDHIASGDDLNGHVTVSMLFVSRVTQQNQHGRRWVVREMNEAIGEAEDLRALNACDYKRHNIRLPVCWRGRMPHGRQTDAKKEGTISIQSVEPIAHHNPS